MTPYTGQYLVSFIFISLLIFFDYTLLLFIIINIWGDMDQVVYNLAIYKSFILKQRYIVDMKNILVLNSRRR